MRTTLREKVDIQVYLQEMIDNNPEECQLNYVCNIVIAIGLLKHSKSSLEKNDGTIIKKRSVLIRMGYSKQQACSKFCLYIT